VLGLLRALAYVWALPNTVLGIVFGVLAFQRPRFAWGIVIFDGPSRGSTWAIGAFDRSAVTLGHVVLSNRPLRGRLLVHELHHVRQYERLGPLYLPAYLAIYAVTGYRRHPFELAAWRAEEIAAPSARARVG